MNTVLWIIQGLLAAIFVMAGIAKLTQPRVKLVKQFRWANDFSLETVRVIGLSEFLGAIGLILPWLTGRITVLTPISAIGLCLIMVLATNLVHLNKKEFKEMALNIILFLLSALVAYGRF